jgi:hypothetical protein
MIGVDRFHANLQQNQHLPRISPEFHRHLDDPPQNIRRQQGGPDMEFARRDLQTLRRIVVMLVALAFPVRWVVLAILRQGEAVAAGFVAETIPADWPCVEQPLETGSGPMDAAWLAWRFRMLAALLGAVLQCECLADCRRIAGAPARAATVGPRLAAMVATAPACADTS